MPSTYTSRWGTWIFPPPTFNVYSINYFTNYMIAVSIPFKKQSLWTPERLTHAPLPWCRNRLPAKRLSSCSLTMTPWVSSACLLCTAHQALCQPDLCREVQVIDTLQPWQTELIHRATLWHSVARMIQKQCSISSNDYRQFKLERSTQWIKFECLSARGLAIRNIKYQDHRCKMSSACLEWSPEQTFWSFKVKHQKPPAVLKLWIDSNFRLFWAMLGPSDISE